MTDYKKFERNSTNKVIGGVCSGLSEYFNIDVALIRVLFVIALLFASFGFWLYILLWIVIPSDKRQDNISSSTSETAPTPISTSESKTTSIFAGIAVILIGLIFLINNFISISWVWKLWPLILVGIGIMIIIKANKKGDDNEQ